jgi:hypothetical protein
MAGYRGSFTFLPYIKALIWTSQRLLIVLVSAVTSAKLRAHSFLLCLYRQQHSLLFFGIFIQTIIFWVTLPPLWSSGQSSWIQIQRSGFDSRHYQIFWEVVGLERGPLSLMRISEELFQSNGGSGRGDPLRWPPDTLYPQKLALTSTTSGGRSVGTVRLRTTGQGVWLFVYFYIDSSIRYSSSVSSFKQ